MTNVKLFGIDIPSINVGEYPLSQAIQEDIKNHLAIGNFYQKIITACENNTLVDISAETEEELDELTASIRTEFEKSNNLIFQREIWQPGRQSNSNIAASILSGSSAKEGIITGDTLRFSVINKGEFEQREINLADHASRIGCKDEFDLYQAIKEKSRNAALHANYEITKCLKQAGKEIKILQIKLRDSVNYDVVNELEIHNKRNIDVHKIQILPSEDAYEGLLTNYKEFVGDNIDCTIANMGTEDIVVRLKVRTPNCYYLTRRDDMPKMAILDNADIVSAYDVVATKRGIYIEPVYAYEGEGEDLRNAVAITMLTQLKNGYKEEYVRVNAKCHQAAMVKGSISAQEAMAIAHHTNSNISSIFNDCNRTTLIESLKFYDEVIAQSVSQKENFTHKATA